MPDINTLIQTITVYALPVLLAITLHEAAHAYAARFFGDNTAYVLGRMTLNPIKHIDPIGTILIPILLYVSTSGAFMFGYAKPVPVNVNQLNKPRRDMAWVAFAGPLSNFVMAFAWAFGLLVLIPLFGIHDDFFYKVCQAGVLVNLIMFALNLFPIPPLDGGRVLVSALPYRYGDMLASVEPYGFFIVLGLSIFHLLSYWMNPLISLAAWLIQAMLSIF